MMGAMRGITKRYFSSELNGSGGYRGTTAVVVGFTTVFDRASNKAYERELHAESRSHLYLPIDTEGDVSTGYDSANRLRQHQRGEPASAGEVDASGFKGRPRDLTENCLREELGEPFRLTYNSF
jgi:hypothetical protein